MTKLLVIRLSAMGDVAMTVPVLKALTKKHPDLEIVMVSQKFLKPLFQDIPQVKFIGVNVKKDYKGLPGLYKLFKKLKTEQPDAVADLHDVIRTKVLRFFFKTAGYKTMVIDKGRAEKKALTRPNHKILKPLKSTHERYTDVFRNLGFDINLKDFHPVKPALSSQVALFLQTFEGQKLIGIAPFAAHIGKQYPMDKIKEVIQILLEKDPDINLLLFGSPQEKAILADLEKINRNRVVNVAGLFSFEEELQLISRLNAMLSMDSGNGHLAALFGVPVVTIWGATHPFAGFAPYGQSDNLQILPDLKKFEQLPTSIYGNKTFEGFEKVWETIPPQKIAETIGDLVI
ncbi:MAG TPA: glycosyltransferase family 9 protein [Flavobacteriia bacterium]|jgi:ADP-heptose:LPS heptosyltransferase|nr:glycosyltransferase family 9 protein [Flavobacteriia bacterium]